MYSGLIVFIQLVCDVASSSGSVLSKEAPGESFGEVGFNGVLLSKKEDLQISLENIAPEYYEAIGAGGVPTGFHEWIKRVSVLLEDPGFEGILLTALPEIIESVSMRLSSELRRRSNVLYAPFHVLMRLLRVTPSSGKWEPRKAEFAAKFALHDLRLSILTHKSTETAVNYYLWYEGIGDYIEIFNGDVYKNKLGGAVDILEQYWLPLAVREPGEELMRTWGDDDDVFYPQELKRVEDYITFGLEQQNGPNKIIEDFFKLVRTTSISDEMNKDSKVILSQISNQLSPITNYFSYNDFNSVEIFSI